MSSQQQVIAELLAFPLGEHTMGAMVPDIEQVMLVKENVVELPRIPDFILGAILDDERLIPLLDLEAYLNLRKPRETFSPSSNAILVTMDQFVYGIYSDHLPQKLMEVPVNPAGEVPDPIPKDWIRSVLDHDGKPIFLIDPDKLWQSLQQ